MTDRQISKQVRGIVFKHYDYWSVFNDLRKDRKSRRLKFMQNGYIFSADRYKEMNQNIIRDLNAAGISFREAGFKSGETYRGKYVYFYVVLPVKGS